MEKAHLEALNVTENVKSEIETLEEIDHHCIVRTLQLLETTEHLYVVMELIPNGDLEKLFTEADDDFGLGQETVVHIML